MLVGIAGLGALGLSLASRFLRAGIDVRALARTESAAASARSGFFAAQAGAGGGLAHSAGPYRVPAETDPGFLASCDIIFICVKAGATARLAGELASALPTGQGGDGAKPALVSLQNGLEHPAILREALPRLPLAYGYTTMGAYRQSASQEVVVSPGGACALGGDEAAYAPALAALAAAGLEAKHAADPDAALWEKITCNAALNPVAALSGKRNGELILDAASVVAMRGLVAETCSVAEALGYALDAQKAVRRLEDICHSTAGNICSMLWDVRAGRPTEIDAINGAVVRAAAAAGRDAPRNRAMVARIRRVEAGYFAGADPRMEETWP